MEVSIVGLRYKTKDVLQALDRNETVKIYYHGKLKGVIQSTSSKGKKNDKKRVQDHAFFGMLTESRDVDAIMDQLRGE